MAVKNEPYLAAELAMTSDQFWFSKEVETVCETITKLRSSSRGVSTKHKEELASSVQWLIDCLFQASEAMPAEWLSLPQNPAYYSPNGPLGGRHGFKVVVQRIIPALQHLGWIKLRLGYRYEPTESMNSRLKARKALLHSFKESKYLWRRLKQNSSDLIQLYDGDRDHRVRLPTPDNSQTKRWHKNLLRFNEFLLDRSICLDRSDAALLDLETHVKATWGKKGDLERPAVNFRKVCLKRIFSRGALNKGGRFYGGWWQTVPSEYRQWISINGKKTVEYDFSSMAIRILYAREGYDLGDTDAYDIGLSDPTPEKRNVVKEFINAMLNDEKSSYKLTPTNRDIIGLNRKDLLRKIDVTHPWLSKHFGTGIGLNLQFEDSKIAEKVMMNMMDEHLVPVLPVHDSFIVRAGYKSHLEEEMRLAFKTVTGRDTRIKATPYKPHPDYISTPSSTLKTAATALSRHRKFSIYLRYTLSNPESILD